MRGRIGAITKQEHYEMICFIRRYTQSTYTAEDYLQDAYLETMERAEQIDDPDKIVSWLKTVAKRKALNEMDKQNKLIKKLIFLAQYPVNSLEDEAVNRVIIQDLLSKVLRQFPMYYRKIVYLRDACGMSYLQIAKELRIKPVTARKAHSRIIKALREQIKEEYK